MQQMRYVASRVRRAPAVSTPSNGSDGTSGRRNDWYTDILCRPLNMWILPDPTCAFRKGLVQIWIQNVAAAFKIGPQAQSWAWVQAHTAGRTNP